MTTSQVTRKYWMTMFSEWANARLSAPQSDEAQAVIAEMLNENEQHLKLQKDIASGVVVLEMPEEDQAD